MLGIRIRMFLGDPDPLVRGTDPDPSLFLLMRWADWNNACKNCSKKIKFLRLKIMCLWVSYKKKIKTWREDSDPDPLVIGTDPEIRIRTKMSRIPNTVLSNWSFRQLKLNLSCLGSWYNAFIILLEKNCYFTQHWYYFFDNCLSVSPS